MKFFTALLLVVLLSVSGCSILDRADKVNEEDKYTALNSLVNDPKSDSEYKVLPGDFTFSAYTISEAEEWDIEGEKIKMVTAVIARNSENVLLIDVNDIKDYNFKEGSFISVTGKLNGSIYFTVDNDQVDVLDIVASKVEELPETTKEATENATFEVKSKHAESKYTYDSAYTTDSTFEKAALVYFDFENLNEKEQGPYNSGLKLYQGNVELKRTIMGADLSPKEGVLKIDHSNKTHGGKTSTYYEVLVAKDSDEKMNATDPIEIVQYDDDFNLVNSWTLKLQ